MKALTLWQPYASLVALGVKTIETRSWDSKYRGPLAIHAAKRLAHVDGEWFIAGRVLCRRDSDEHHPLPLGAVVATATLVDVVPTIGRGGCPSGAHVANGSAGKLWRCDADHGDFQGHDISDQLPYGDFTPGRYAWLLDDVKPTTERCLECEGGKRVPDLRPEARRSFGYPQDWRTCPTCDGSGVCPPVPAKGHQGIWEWTP